MQTEIRPDVKLPTRMKMNNLYRSYFKRLIDICGSLLAIIVLSPVLLITALLVRTKLGSPIIFNQKRPGLNEEIFTLYKFRTMTDTKDENGELLSDNLRITYFGNMLRKTSFDELPELFNILKGDMSIVGSRPLVVEYLPYYTPDERHRHDMRPGLTGLAQVSGRSYLSWEERFVLDNEYVRTCSFVLDCKIIWKTALLVLKRMDIADIESVRTDEKGEYVYHEGNVFRRLDDTRRGMNV